MCLISLLWSHSSLLFFPLLWISIPVFFDHGSLVTLRCSPYSPPSFPLVSLSSPLFVCLLRETSCWTGTPVTEADKRIVVHLIPYASTMTILFNDVWFVVALSCRNVKVPSASVFLRHWPPTSKFLSSSSSFFFPLRSRFSITASPIIFKSVYTCRWIEWCEISSVISKQYSGVDWSCDVSVTYYYNIEIFLFFPPFMTSGDTTFFHCWW